MLVLIYYLNLTSRKMTAQKIAPAMAKPILPCEIPPMKASGANTADIVANLSRMIDFPMTQVNHPIRL
jgi:hypothetical protein